MVADLFDYCSVLEAKQLQEIKTFWALRYVSDLFLKGWYMVKYNSFQSSYLNKYVP